MAETYEIRSIFESSYRSRI